MAYLAVYLAAGGLYAIGFLQPTGAEAHSQSASIDRRSRLRTYSRRHSPLSPRPAAIEGRHRVAMLEPDSGLLLDQRMSRPAVSRARAPSDSESDRGISCRMRAPLHRLRAASHSVASVPHTLHRRPGRGEFA